LFGLFIKSDLRDLALRRSGSRLRHGATARIDEEAVMSDPSQSTRPFGDVHYREATEHDAWAIAKLHADSWRRHYRGAFLDQYLDGDILTERVEVWSARLALPQRDQVTVCAEDDADIIGFAHTIFGYDPTWGALLDNLHVRSDQKRSGIGTRLFSEAVRELGQSRPSESLHLWVLDQNEAAQLFYEARGGTRVETAWRGPFPGGGRAIGHRYAWWNPVRLVQQRPVQ
jgi:ribosomal protein S18 acetylase RimI-like enzyme